MDMRGRDYKRVSENQISNSGKMSIQEDTTRRRHTIYLVIAD